MQGATGCTLQGNPTMASLHYEFRKSSTVSVILEEERKQQLQVFFYLRSEALHKTPTQRQTTQIDLRPSPRLLKVLPKRQRQPDVYCSV